MLNNLYVKYAMLLSVLVLFEECRKYAKYALDFFSNAYDRSDHMIARIYIIIGDSYLMEKDRKKAETYYELAIQLYADNGWGAEGLRDAIQEAIDKNYTTEYDS